MVETDSHVETFLFQCFDTPSLNKQANQPAKKAKTKVLFAMFW